MADTTTGAAGSPSSAAGKAQGNAGTARPAKAPSTSSSTSPTTMGSSGPPCRPSSRPISPGARRRVDAIDDDSEDGWCKQKYAEWRRAFETAADGGAAGFF